MKREHGDLYRDVSRNLSAYYAGGSEVTRLHYSNLVNFLGLGSVTGQRLRSITSVYVKQDNNLRLYVLYVYVHMLRRFQAVVFTCYTIHSCLCL
jgi:hypothetical protein